MSETVSRPLTEAEQTFKDLIWLPLLRLGEGALETSVPALNFPILKQVDEFILESLAEWLYSQIVMLLDVETIRLANAEHQAAYDKASLTLKIIAKDKGATSPEFAEAKENAKKALSQFVRFNM